jgi:EF hand
MKTSFVSLCFLTATLFAGSAFAQSEAPATPPPAAPGEEQPFRQRMLERFDTNHDGKLDDTERAAARAAWQIRATERREVRDEIRAQLQENRQAILARFDRNSDGKLDENERAELRQAWQEFLKQRPVLTPAPVAPAGT